MHLGMGEYMVDKVGGAFGMHGREDQCMPGFCGET